MDLRAEGLGLGSIQEINALPREVAEALYARLVPDELFDRFGIDPSTLCDRDGARLVRVTAPPDKPWARVEVRSSTEDRDPALLVDVEMSPLSVPELAFVQITDPAGPRFAIDRDPDGRDTLFGTASRNVVEEARAMRDGPGPRAGAARPAAALAGAGRDGGLLHADRQGDLPHRAALLPLGHPLRAPGLRLPDGPRRDGGDPRRLLRGRGAADGARRLLAASARPDAARTVRGRSWALHDGVIEGLWGGAGWAR